MRTNSWVWASTPGVTRISTVGLATSGPVAPAAPVREQSLEPLDLVEGVDDDPADADRQRRGQLVVGLVVAVQHQPVGRDPGGQGHVQLAAGRDVQAIPSSWASRAMARHRNALVA